jgi:hypothetical protein
MIAGRAGLGSKKSTSICNAPRLGPLDLGRDSVPPGSVQAAHGRALFSERQDELRRSAGNKPGITSPVNGSIESRAPKGALEIAHTRRGEGVFESGRRVVKSITPAGVNRFIIAVRGCYPRLISASPPDGCASAPLGRLYRNHQPVVAVGVEIGIRQHFGPRHISDQHIA